MLSGIDISHWQNEIDWMKVKRSGVKFAFIHATQFAERSTELKVSPKLIFNIQQASANNISWSVWHQFCIHIDPVIQAEAFLKSIDDHSCLPPSIKLDQAGLKPERLNYKLRRLLEAIEERTGQKPIICTTCAFWQTYMVGEKETLTDWAREYPLWLTQHHNMWPSPLYPWAGWTFWEYTDNGRLPGIQTNVSMSWFNGSQDDMSQMMTKLITQKDPQMKRDEEINNLKTPNSNGGVEQSDEKAELQPQVQKNDQDVSHNKEKAESLLHTSKEGTWVDTYFFNNKN